MRAEIPAGNEFEAFCTICNLRGKRVIEVGCGYGRFTKEIACVAKEVVGVDNDEAELKRAPEIANVEFMRGDATGLGFPDKSFDVAVCVFSLHEIAEEDMGQVIKEMKRVAKEVVFVEPISRGVLSGKLFHAVEGQDAVAAAWKAIESAGVSLEKDAFTEYCFESFDDMYSLFFENYEGKAEYLDRIIGELDKFRGKTDFVLKEWFRVARIVND